MERINRQILYKMIPRFGKIYLRIFGSVLVPVFLFMFQPQAISGEAVPEIAITFQIKNAQDNQAVFARYGLNSTPLFQNIFKAKVSVDTYQSLQADPLIVYARSEEHTSELQSPDHLVCRLLLEKKTILQLMPHIVLCSSSLIRLASFCSVCSSF